MPGTNRPHSHSGWGSMSSGENMPVMSDEGLSALTPVFRDDERVTSGRGIAGWNTDFLGQKDYS